MATTDEIRTWLDHADDLDAQVEDMRRESNDLRWKSAEALWEAQRPGPNRKTQRALKAEINKPGFSQSNISFYTRIWRDHGEKSVEVRPTFAEAYQEIKMNDDSKKGHKPSPGGRSRASGSETEATEPEPTDPDPDYRGNQEAPLIVEPVGSSITEPEPTTMIGKVLLAMDTLVDTDPKEVVLLLLDDEYDTRSLWGRRMASWVDEFNEALEDRFAHSPDPISAA